MTTVAFIILSALIYRLHGWAPADGKPNPKAWEVWAGKLTTQYTMAPFFGLLCGWYFASWVVIPVAAIGWLVGVVWGIGDYFDFSEAPNKELATIDLVTSGMDNGPKRDLISMTLRGILFWPLFAGLSIVLHSYFILGFLTILMGPIYYLWDYKIPRFGFNHGCAELTMGTMLAIIALVKVGTLSIGIL